MTKAPKKHDDDDDEKLDSTKHHEERKAKIEAENEQNEMVAKEVAENQEIANFRGLPKEGETREQLLARIRKMREDVPKEVEVETFRSEGMQKEFDAEQEAGKAAVAKAVAEMKRNEAALANEDGGKK